MKKYLVTIVVIVGYKNWGTADPILRYDEYEVEAGSENDAIEKASKLDQTKFSFWERYAVEI